MTAASRIADGAGASAVITRFPAGPFLFIGGSLDRRVLIGSTGGSIRPIKRESDPAFFAGSPAIHILGYGQVRITRFFFLPAMGRAKATRFSGSLEGTQGDSTRSTW